MSNEPTASEPAQYGPPIPPPLPVDPMQFPLIDPVYGAVVPYAPYWLEKRLHPATVIVQVVRFLRSIGGIILLAVVLRSVGRPTDLIELVAAMFGAFGIVGAVLKYVSVRYSVHGGSLHVKSGILVRQERTIPLERIQNINLRQELVHRLLGVADVRIETASGGDAEAELSVVSLTEAEAIRHALLYRAAPPVDVAAEPPLEEVVYRASIGDLALAGATTNRLGTLLAAVLGVLAYAQSISGRSTAPVRDIGRVAEQWSMPGWTTLLLAGLALVLLGWLTSIVLSIVNRYGFELVRTHGQLRRTFGLLTRHASIFPVERVQILRVTSPLIQRQIGLCHVSAETAGSFKDAQQASAGSSELCPILRRARADAMCRLAVPDFSLDAVSWTSVHPLARRRAMARCGVVFSVFVGLAALARGPWALLAFIAAWPICFGIAWLYYRSLGYCVRGGNAAIRRGVLTQVVDVVPLRKVQASFVTQSPLQRRLGLATLKLLTAGSGFGNSASVPDVGLAVALQLQDEVHRRESPAGGPDGEVASTEPHVGPALPA